MNPSFELNRTDISNHQLNLLYLSLRIHSAYYKGTALLLFNFLGLIFFHHLKSEEPKFPLWLMLSSVMQSKNFRNWNRAL